MSKVTSSDSQSQSFTIGSLHVHVMLAVDFTRTRIIHDCINHESFVIHDSCSTPPLPQLKCAQTTLCIVLGEFKVLLTNQCAVAVIPTPSLQH